MAISDHNLLAEVYNYLKVITEKNEISLIQ